MVAKGKDFPWALRGTEACPVLKVFNGCLLQNKRFQTQGAARCSLLDAFRSARSRDPPRNNPINPNKASTISK